MKAEGLAAKTGVVMVTAAQKNLLRTFNTRL